MAAPITATNDAAQVGGLHALPGSERCVEHRRVVDRRDARIVEEDVDEAHLLARVGVGAAHGPLVGQVRL
jgi:hypothetical protein